MSKVKSRFAPSPTGKLHIGNVHTFLFNYCFTKHEDGEVALRIEDTDRERSKDEFVEDITNSLTWLGLKWDGPIHFQSKEHVNYLSFAEQLLKSGDAYYCYHTQEELEEDRKKQEAEGKAPRYSGACRNLTPEQVAAYEKEGRKPSIRFRMTGDNRPKEITYQDLVYGEITYNPEDIGDFVIVRSDKTVLYNFGNVIDDHGMEITHVVRGQSHLTNTPRQILLYKSLGWTEPRFGHLPEVLNPDRVGKLSKRYGAAAVSEFQEMGYLPDALVNFLGSLGWSHPEGKEFFDLHEMVAKFSFERVSKSPAALDLEKLDFYNAYYLRKLTLDEFEKILSSTLKSDNFDLIKQIAPLMQDRVSNNNDIHKYADYFFEDPSKPKFKSSQYNKVLALTSDRLEKIDPWTEENIEKELRETQQSSGIEPKEFFVTVGQAISGQDVFLPLFNSIKILGIDKVLSRLRHS